MSIMNDPRLVALREQRAAHRELFRTALTETRAEVARAQAAHRPLTDADINELSERARSGDLGDAFVEVQSKIDAKKFTWADVLTGRAPDDAVAAFRELAGQVRMVAQAADGDESADNFVRRLAQEGRPLRVVAGD